jgi:hypothetical protein
VEAYGGNGGELDAGHRILVSGILHPVSSIRHRENMRFRNTLILFGVVVILFVLVYAFEIRKPGESTEKSKNLGEMLLVKKENVNKVELIYADPNYEKLVCFKDDNGEWQIEQPLKAKADQNIMDRLISNAMSKNIHSTLKDPGEPTEYGLGNPRVTATFHLLDGISRTLMLGDTVPTGNYAYFKQKGISDISLVPASMVDDLTKFVSDLRDRTVIALRKSDVQKIQLKYGNRKTITCQKSPLSKGGTKGGFEWNLVEPVAAKADTSEVEKIISDLNDLKVASFVADAPADLSAYGLSQPQIEVTASLKDEKRKALLIGTKENGSVYVKTASDEPVFLVNAEIIDKLTKQPSDLRDKTVIAFDRKTVERLELKYPKRSIVCEKKPDEEGELWEITSPTSAKADKSQIDEILRKLRELRVREFILDEPKNLAVYGLARPQVRAIIVLRGSEPEMLLVGKKARGSVYVKTASVESVYLVDAGIMDDLSKETLDLRDKQVMKFEQQNVKRIELKRKDKTIVCIKQERDWRLVEPVKEKAKNYEVNDILNKLDDLKAERFVAEKAARLSEYGLDQPDVEVAVTFEDNSTEKLLVGEKLPDSDSAYAKTAAEDIIFVIEKDVVDELKKDVDEMLDAGY